ncbi:hypothetical protein [Caballeronia sp. RCC_10]|uniref:hypothetical protein n=1 Tax=Caballeronia sp. RCC_10 TaxID=3239227 RepID=UPI0035247FD0
MLSADVKRLHAAPTAGSVPSAVEQSRRRYNVERITLSAAALFVAVLVVAVLIVLVFVVLIVLILVVSVLILVVPILIVFVVLVILVLVALVLLRRHGKSPSWYERGMRDVTSHSACLSRSGAVPSAFSQINVGKQCDVATEYGPGVVNAQATAREHSSLRTGGRT